ncbi:hypothetical protein Bpfe_021779, partial [Biomphalaria pfeifferi]
KMRLAYFLLVTGLVLSVIEPSLASDKQNKEKNKNDNKDKHDRNKEKEIQKNVQDNLKDMRKEISAFVRDIKDEVKDTLSSAIIDKLKEKLDKIEKKDKKEKDDSSESSESSKEMSPDDIKRYKNLEQALAREIENLAKDVKSKIIDLLLKKKEYIKASVQEKLKLVSEAIEKIKSGTREDEDNESKDQVNEDDQAKKEKLILKVISTKLDAALEHVLFNELNGTLEPTSDANGAVVRLLLHRLLNDIQPDIARVKESWRDFVSAEFEMKVKAKKLHAKEVVDGKVRDTFTFEKLRSFKESLKEMLDKKRNFVEQKIELKNKVLFTLRNMSLVHRARTGQDFSYVEFLEGILNGTIKIPQALKDLFEDVKTAVEDLKKENANSEIPTQSSEVEESTPAAVELTTSIEENAEESSVLDILNKVQDLETDLKSKITSLENDVKAKVLEQVQNIREVITSLVLEDNTGVSENPSLLYNISSDNPFLNDIIETAIRSLVTGNATEVTLSGNQALLNLFIQNLLKEFDASIQRLKQWKERFDQIRGVLVSIADNLQNAVNEAEDVSTVPIDLTEYKHLLQEIHNVKALYVTQKYRVKTLVLEAFDKMTSVYQNRTGTDLSYNEVLSSMTNSSSDLTPLLDDFYSDLSTVAKSEGLKFDAVDPNSSDSLGGEGSSSSVVGVAVVSTIVVVLAAFGIGFFVFRRHRKQSLYTKI